MINDKLIQEELDRNRSSIIELDIKQNNENTITPNSERDKSSMQVSMQPTELPNIND